MAGEVMEEVAKEEAAEVVAAQEVVAWVVAVLGMVALEEVGRAVQWAAEEARAAHQLGSRAAPVEAVPMELGMRAGGN